MLDHSGALTWVVALSYVLLAFGGGGGGGGGWSGGGGGGLAAAWGVGPCRISEFACASGKCVRPDAFCDGRDNCGDGSDEPPYCTVCNRTYYGEESVTYELSVERPRGSGERLPFLCHLTFTATGRGHGDIVQIIFDSFQVGRYDPTPSSAIDRCPDGHLQLSELGRPFTGGSWCGGFASTSNGPTAAQQQAQSQRHQPPPPPSAPSVYFSETATLTASVRLYRPSPGFSLKMRYRFLPRRAAVLRYGPALPSPYSPGSAAAPFPYDRGSPGRWRWRVPPPVSQLPRRLPPQRYLLHEYPAAHSAHLQARHDLRGAGGRPGPAPEGRPLPASAAPDAPDLHVALPTPTTPQSERPALPVAHDAEAGGGTGRDAATAAPGGRRGP